MVSLAAGPLTKIGFRRDVKLFLSSLVGFLVILIFTLVLVLRTSFEHTEMLIDRNERIVTEIATDVINHSPADSLETQFVSLRSRFNVAGIELQGRDGRHIASGETRGELDDQQRLTGPGTLTLHFDAGQHRALRRRFIVTSGICVTAASLGIALLLLYVPRILRPIEAMLDDARQLGERGDQEETSYLVDSFRSSITTLKAQEAELKRLHELEKTRADDLERVTAALTRSLTSGLIAVDARGEVVDVNAAGREILGIPAHAVVAGRAPGEIVPLPRFAATLTDSFAQQEPMTRVEIEDIRPGGESAVIGLTTVPIRNEGGAFLGFLVLFTDLTHIRGLETRVQEMQALAQLGEISAGIAHELRNSVSTILGYMQLARRSGVDDVAAGRLRSAEKEAALLLQAIERLVAFARPIPLNAEPVDLHEVVDDQVRQLGDIAADVQLTVDGPPVVIDGDRVLLSRAIDNLLRNAVDAVREKGGGSVHISLATSPPTLTITDDGIGFDPAETPRLFLPFHSNKPNGFGMGLPLAKKIVLLHGGTLRLQGEPGKGATATMQFADVQAAPVPGGASETAVPRLPPA
jgi:PAS domain S-box-containing protein